MANIDIPYLKNDRVSSQERCALFRSAHHEVCGTSPHQIRHQMDRPIASSWSVHQVRFLRAISGCFQWMSYLSTPNIEFHQMFENQDIDIGHKQAEKHIVSFWARA